MAPGSVVLLLVAAAVTNVLALQEPVCPEPYGEFAYGHPERCDQFFLCSNGTLTLETCENGLLFDGKGAVHNHCNYNWAVDCGVRKHDQYPINAPGCEYAFGIYPDSNDCSTSYLKCVYAEPIPQPCEKGLVYDDRIHGCNWPDEMLEICNPEAVVGFKCPAKVDSNSPAARFWPYPRFAAPGSPHHLITCVNGYPRLIGCGEEKIFDPNTLTCEEP